MSIKKIVHTPSAYQYPLLIKNLLSTPLIYSPDKEIVYRDKSRYTYKTLYKRICQLANTLKNLGVKEGDTIGVMDVDSHRYLECFFAIPMIGAVLHTIHIRLTTEQIAYTINHAEDDVIIVNADLLPILESAKNQLKTVKKIILMSDDGNIPQTQIALAGEYENLLGQADGHYDFPDFDEEAMATAFYTSGTTGNPKGVYYSHRQLVLHTYGLMAALTAYKAQASFNSEDVYMPLTPMFHVHAWGVPYLATLLGTKQVYPGRYEPEMILKLIVKEKVTLSHCVPTIMHMLVNSPAMDKIDLSGWKVIIGGSALSKGLCKAAMNKNINLYTAYGMSETCPLLTAALLKPHMLDWDIDKQVDVRCKTGLPAPMVTINIVDPDGHSIPHDGKSTGEIVARAPWLTQGYLKEPEKSEELWKNGVLHTGDIGYIDKEGYLQITDRLKDVIKSGGEWISSLELEDIISQHPAVSEAAVIGVHDEKWGERPCAHIILKEDAKGKVTVDDIKSFIMKQVEKGNLPKYGVPGTIIFVDVIPKTGVGKINKKHIRSQYTMG
ncbi:MAG: fatty acid--CoA ligase [Proteobacteria bacterium]|nr:fatty acid--CoA ligase [Pseudomonadota bacterium]